jgi:hypothetical protein
VKTCDMQSHRCDGHLLQPSELLRGYPDKFSIAKNEKMP